MEWSPRAEKVAEIRENGAQEPQIEAKSAKMDEKSCLRARGVEKGGFFTPKCGPGWLHKGQRAAAGDPRSGQGWPKETPKTTEEAPRGTFGSPFRGKRDPTIEFRGKFGENVDFSKIDVLLKEKHRF